MYQLFFAVSARNMVMALILLIDICGTLLQTMTWFFTTIELTMVISQMMYKIFIFMFILLSYYVGFAVFDYVNYGVADGQGNFLYAILKKISERSVEGLIYKYQVYTSLPPSPGLFPYSSPFTPVPSSFPS